MNLLTNNLQNAVGIEMLLSNGAVSESNRFNEKGALNTVNNGVSNFTDVYGALDWEYPRYIGVRVDLDDYYSCDSVVLYSGTADYPEKHRVYASNNLDTLYEKSSIIADGIVTDGSGYEIPVSGNYRYFAFFCIEYEICQRFNEIEIYGNKKEVDFSGGFYVNGNKIYNQDGVPIILKGVNITELSWSVYGDGNTAEGKSDADTSLKNSLDWGSSIVRLAVNPEFYVNGGTSKGVYKTAVEYRNLVDRFISTITNRSVAVILDCHDYYGVTETVRQFWQIAAPLYDNNEFVLYGLLNEPVSDWITYYEGGETHGKKVTGMPSLLDLVRSKSDNVAVIGGIDFAFDLSCVGTEDFNNFAVGRASALNMSVSDYKERYFLGTSARKGRGIILDSHIYSTKPYDWDNYILKASKEFPIILGEFGPTYREGVLTDFTTSEIAYMQRIFRYMERNDLSFTAWGLNAWPFLTTTTNNTITPFGQAVKNYILTENIPNGINENLLNTQYKACRPIARDTSNNNVYYHNAFYDQASGNGSNIAKYLTDGDTETLYDIYAWNDHLMGVEYQLNDMYAGNTIRLSSGLNNYPDKYVIYASDNINTLYNSENIIENLTTEFKGSVSFFIDKPIKYVAILADGYVRIKELELYGYQLGDNDNDGKINSPDIILLRKEILGIDSINLKATADINLDNQINIIDLIKLKKRLLQ